MSNKPKNPLPHAQRSAPPQAIARRAVEAAKEAGPSLFQELRLRVVAFLLGSFFEI